MQHAMHLAAHSDPKVHARYVMQTAAMRAIPEAALPPLPATALAVANDSPRERSPEPPAELVRHVGIVTAGDDSTGAQPELPRKCVDSLRCGRDSNPRMTVLQN